jgi:hypothetical protein
MRRTSLKSRPPNRIRCRTPAAQVSTAASHRSDPAHLNCSHIPRYSTFRRPHSDVHIPLFHIPLFHIPTSTFRYSTFRRPHSVIPHSDVHIPLFHIPTSKFRYSTFRCCHSLYLHVTNMQALNRWCSGIRHHGIAWYRHPSGPCTQATHRLASR